MKNKSLVIISFAFIFLLSMSIVSAGFWDWLTGRAAGGEYECPPLPQGICDGDADPKSITIGSLREMVKAAGGEYECPPLPQGICDGDADPKSLAFKKGDNIVVTPRTKAGVSSSGTRCGTPNTPVCDNAGIITRTDGKRVKPMLGVNNNRGPRSATINPVQSSIRAKTTSFTVN